MPRDFSDPLQNKVGQRGLSAIAAFYDELQAELNRRLSKKYKANPFLSSVLEDSQAIIQEYQDVLADILGDAQLASWLVGAGELAHQFDPELYRRLGFGEPPIKPPIVSAAEDWSFDGMRTWLPLVDKSVERLKELGVFTKEEYSLLSDQMRQNAFTVAGLKTTEAVAKVHQALIDSVQEGTGLVEFKDALSNSLKTSAIGPGHLENIMRTGQSRAYSDGMNKIHSHPLVRPAFPYVETLPIRDNRLTDLCDIISGSGIQGTGIFRVDDPVWNNYGNIPRHWQCFLPGTRVEGRFEIGLKSFYSGEAIEMFTARGNRLAVTVNHPIMTSAGFIAAGDLRKGDNLVSYSCQAEERLNLSRSRNPLSLVTSFTMPSEYKENPPVVIEKVFRSLLNMSNGATRFSPTTSYDFHGDSKFGDGYVYIVDPFGKLLFNSQSSFTEFVGNLFLSFVNKYLTFKSDFSILDRYFNRLRSTFIVIAHHLSSFSSFLITHSLPFGNLSFGTAANLYTHFNKSVSQNTSNESAFITQLFKRFARLIPRGQVLDVRNYSSDSTLPLKPSSFGLSSQLNSSTFQHSSNSHDTNSNIFTQLQERYPGVVSFDNIVDVRKYNYTGHVYDLQSDCGWLIAEGIIASNCRCGKRFMTIEDAARKGILEAMRWLDGEEPTSPAFVDEPELDHESRKLFESFRGG